MALIQLHCSYLQVAELRARASSLLALLWMESSSLSQLLLQLPLPIGQCWIGAARKEPVILNQFCATGSYEGFNNMCTKEWKKKATEERSDWWYEELWLGVGTLKSKWRTMNKQHARAHAYQFLRRPESSTRGHVQSECTTKSCWTNVNEYDVSFRSFRLFKNVCFNTGTNQKLKSQSQSLWKKQLTSTYIQSGVAATFISPAISQVN